MKNTGCFRIAIVGMVLTGVWFPENIQNKCYKIVFFLYALFYQCVFFFGTISIEIMHLTQVINNLQKSAEVSLLLLTHLAQLAKIVTIWCRQSKIKHLLHELESPAFNREESAKKIILSRTIRLAYLVSKTYSLIVIVTASMWGVFPLLKATTSTLTLPLGYPYVSQQSSVMFAVLYVYQLSSIVLNGFGNTAVDFLAGGLTMLASAQLDVLSCELGEMRGAVGGSENDDNIDYSYRQAVNCIEYHHKIIRFVKEIENIFSVPVFLQFALACMVVCMTAFKIAGTNETTQIIKLMFYLANILMELLVYCYFGHVIIYKSQKVAEAVYSSDWQRTSVKTQRSLLLLMLRAQRPLSITAGKRFHLSLVTFVAILRSSYSYYAVLNHHMKNCSL